MTIYQAIQIIRDEHFHDLPTKKSKQFIEDVYEALDGVPIDINDEDVTEYLSPRQIEWINDIAVFLNLTGASNDQKTIQGNT